MFRRPAGLDRESPRAMVGRRSKTNQFFFFESPTSKDIFCTITLNDNNEITKETSRIENNGYCANRNDVMTEYIKFPNSTPPRPIFQLGIRCSKLRQ